MSDETRKKVDENWKNQVDKEKGEAKETSAHYHEPSFSVFVSSLSMQAMIAMGKLQNPVTKAIEKNFDQARYLIDTLGIIEEKSKNNLTDEESSVLGESLYNLRIMYVEERGENA